MGVIRLIFLTSLVLLLSSKLLAQDNSMHKANQLLISCDYRGAIAAYGKSLKSCTNCSDSILVMLNLNLANARVLNEEYSKAFDSFQKALQIANESNSKHLIVQSNIYIAEYYRNRGNYKKAREYIGVAGNLVLNNTVDKGCLASYYNRHASILNEDGGSVDSVILMSNKALNLAIEIGDKLIEASSLNELGFMEEHYGEPFKAIAYYRSAKEIWLAEGDLRHAVHALSNLSRVFLKIKDPNSSLNTADIGIQLVGKNEWSSILVDLFFRKKEALIALGEYVKANEVQDQYHNEVLKLREKEWTQEMALINGELQLEQKDKRIKDEKAKQEKIKIDLNNQRSWFRYVFISLIVASILILIILGLGIRSMSANKKLKKSITEKQLLLQEVHHRVKNNMQMVSSVLDLHSSFVKDKEAIKAIKKGQDRIQSLALAHQNLYQNERYDSIKLRQYLTSIARSVCPKDVEWKLDLEEKEFDIEKAQAMGFIINELIMNSVEHAWKKGETNKKIIMHFEKRNQGWAFTYRDNGKGVANKEEFSNSATFGMTIIKSFLRRNLKTEMEFGDMEGMHIVFNVK